jgi:pyrimidine-nucleoside phosphorylase
MRTLPEARELAEAMRELGTGAGREVVCLLTDMDQPLGRAVGNALEIREALATIRGDGPPDFTELVTAAASKLVALSDLGVDEAAARERVEAAMGDGSAEAAYRRWIEAQGGDPGEDRLPTAPIVEQVPSDREGWITRIRALPVGIVALELGAGRHTKADEIDHSVGVVFHRKRGERVATGEPIAEIHARDESSARRAGERLLAAFEIGEEPGPAQGVVLDVIS